MQYHSISTAAYETLRYNIILNVEENGVPKLSPYLDSVGIATIGVGLNLSVSDGRNQWGQTRSIIKSLPTNLAI